MPYTVAVSFDEFLSRISLTGDHSTTANARRDRIVRLLKDDFEILKAFPTGSIVRRTALKSSDLDVIVALHYGQHVKGKTPTQVLSEVRDHLGGSARIVKKNGQAVSLYFATWPNVDVVPVKRVANDGTLDYYGVPDMETDSWLVSRPWRHDSSVSGLSLESRQRIRMIKTWNQAHSDYMESFHIETIALSAPPPTDDWPWDVFQFFDYAMKTIDSPLKHPRDAGDYVDDYLNAYSRAEVKTRLARACSLSRDAWHEVYPPRDNHRKSIETYRILFGDRFPAYG